MTPAPSALSFTTIPHMAPFGTTGRHYTGQTPPVKTFCASGGWEISASTCKRHEVPAIVPLAVAKTPHPGFGRPSIRSCLALIAAMATDEVSRPRSGCRGDQHEKHEARHGHGRDGTERHEEGAIAQRLMAVGSKPLIGLLGRSTHPSDPIGAGHDVDTGFDEHQVRPAKGPFSRILERRNRIANSAH